MASLQLLYRYFHARSSGKLYPLIPPRQTFPTSTRYDTHTESSHRYSIRIPFYEGSSFQTTSSPGILRCYTSAEGVLPRSLQFSFDRLLLSMLHIVKICTSDSPLVCPYETQPGVDHMLRITGTII